MSIMRATVGPLPSAVYWRRRAVVLGVALLGIIVLFVSCSGNSPNDQRGKGTPVASSPTPGPQGSASSPSPTPSFLDGSNQGEPSRPAPGDIKPGAGGTGTGTGTADGTVPGQSTTGNNTAVTAPTSGSCTDGEMQVLPVLTKATLGRNEAVDIQIKIKNVGSRTCARDVGAGPQELYLEQGAQKFWSSDTCSPAKNSDVHQFAPGAERDFRVRWNGLESTTCADGSAAGSPPPAGQFELRARLGTKVSNAVTLTIA